MGCSDDTVPSGTDTDSDTGRVEVDATDDLAVADTPVDPDAGTDTSVSPDADSDEDSGSDPVVSDLPTDPTVDLLSGTWAEFSQIAVITEVPIVGQAENATVSIQRVTIEQDGDELSLTSELCDLYIVSSISLVETVFPDAFIAALPISTRPATLEEQGGTLHFQAPRYLQLRGVVLEDPENDPLPTDPADSRIIDQDDDGHPGMTVRIRGLVDGEIYVIQRAWNSYTGQVTDDDHIDGLVQWGDEQVILGTDNPLLGSPLDNVPDPDAEKSFVRMVRIEPSLSCEDIAAQADELFGD